MRIEVKVENAKIYGFKTINCKNGKTLSKFAIRLGSFNDNQQGKFVNVLYWGSDLIVPTLPISFNARLDLSHYMNQAGLIITSTNLIIDKFEQITLDNQGEVVYEKLDNELEKLEAGVEETPEWFKEGGKE